ncbi:arginyl-tRNA synthetase [Glaciihabitans sp. INWT7]|uniref:arginyl-tRNA synthetase n=1 Tax=Glaciihabitans sp. INWT7 TaxID=2596912 RepID=UPI001623C05E|nr:arginyl-tRNA synthetase [Glaciihabitans sp. INWT7]QNE46407.1 arginyl-tRNA synthetase [Glaciihabitans sp. INWT7]
MNSIVDTRLRSTIVVVALAATVTLGLAGCVPEPKSSTGATPSTSSAPSASPSVVPSPTSSPSSTASATPTNIACNTLVSAQAVYDFNPNFGLDRSFSPKAGTAGATAIADKGTACSWLNQTSGDTFAIAVARPAAPEVASLKATAANGTAASGLGDAAYFSTSGGAGRVDVFTGSYWLVATSVYFGSAADANALVTAALGALK